MSIACVRMVSWSKGGVCTESLSRKTGYRNNSHNNSVSVAMGLHERAVGYTHSMVILSSWLFGWLKYYGIFK